ncbi:MAG TPA: hypothetical protein VMI93_00970 [Candidatus Solibacter sp.]|nr:hypothetical protein [Candidatus Solibacter sp.]
MSTEHNPTGGPPAGYETRDANAASLVKFAIGLALMLVVTWAGMLWLLKYFQRVQPGGPAATPFSKLHEKQLPPLPRIQVEPVRELEQVRERQNDVLNTYGWADRAHGVVRIPIDEAMKLVLERGALPARESTAAAGAAGTQSSSKTKSDRGKGTK